MKLRNWAAHPDDYTLDYPPSVADSLRQVAEYINMLWGHATPDGSTFKTRVHRRPRVVGISPTGDASVEFLPDQISTLAPEHRLFSFTVFKMADDEPDASRPAMGPGSSIEATHKEGFQTTHFPCETLFEGDWHDLNEAVEAGMFGQLEDEVEWLERTFFIHESDDELDHPRSRDDLLRLDPRQPGCWWVIVADGPWDAYAHVRDHRDADLDEARTCSVCCVAVTAVCPDVPTALAATASMFGAPQ